MTAAPQACLVDAPDGARQRARGGQQQRGLEALGALAAHQLGCLLAAQAGARRAGAAARKADAHEAPGQEGQQQNQRNGDGYGGADDMGNNRADVGAPVAQVHLLQGGGARGQRQGPAGGAGGWRLGRRSLGACSLEHPARAALLEQLQPLKSLTKRTSMTRGGTHHLAPQRRRRRRRRRRPAARPLSASARRAARTVRAARLGGLRGGPAAYRHAERPLRWPTTRCGRLWGAGLALGLNSHIAGIGNA